MVCLRVGGNRDVQGARPCQQVTVPKADLIWRYLKRRIDQTAHHGQQQVSDCADQTADSRGRRCVVRPSIALARLGHDGQVNCASGRLAGRVDREASPRTDGGSDCRLAEAGIA